MALTLKNYQDATKGKRPLGEDGQPMDEIHDGGNLSIRWRGKLPTWCYRPRMGGSKLTLVIGPLDSWGLADARRRRDEAAELIRSGVHPKAFFAARQTLADWKKAEAERTAREEAAARKAEAVAAASVGMKWSEAVAGFLTDAATRLRPATVTSYRLILTLPDVRSAGWDNRKLSTIGEDDLKAIQNRLVDRGCRSAAKALQIAVQQVLRWSSGRAGSGIKRAFTRQMEPIAPGQSKTQYLPKPGEIGNLLWKLNDSTLHPSLRLASAMVLLTSQRAATVVRAKIGEFTQDDEGVVWQIPSPHMKGKRSHAIPLPPLVAAVVDAARSLAAGNKEQWLFPQTRLRDASTPGTNHVPPSTLAHVYKDVEAGYSPHGTRRGFVQHGRPVGISLSDSALILDHREGLHKSVTATKYGDGDERRDIKRPIMEKWVSYVIEQTLACRPDGAPTWPAFMPPLPS